MKLLLASSNEGKLAEFSQLLHGFDLLPWPKGAPSLPETGAFFQDNALQKAVGALAWWRQQGCGPVEAVVADDSGLCVDALWGGPGVLSARFAPDLPDYASRNRRLLAMLPDGAPRSARFVCVLACVPLEGAPFTVGAAVEGTLAPEVRGTGGFGYDPIFIPEGYDRTFGELPAAVKHTLSHRARACALLRARLEG